MKDLIVSALEHIERAENVKILYAVESGSRAWGFASPDSDWDVRYIYVRPVQTYLEIDARRDVLDGYHKMDCIKGHPEFNVPLLDITGWDLKKTLMLMRKGNPQVGEWLRSPIVYRDHWKPLLTELEPKVMRLFPAQEHYRAMAKTNFREFLQGERVRYKKYLYVLRPLLCAQYIRAFNQFPPVLFNEVMDRVLPLYPDGEQVGTALANLLAVKSRSTEVEDAPRDPVLHAFIEREVNRKDGLIEAAEAAATRTEILNQFFIDTLRDVGGFVS